MRPPEEDATSPRYLTPTQARRLYDRIGRLQDTQLFYERPARHALIAAAGFETARGVLEFGCGTASLAETVLARLPRSSRYVGIDSSATMVALSRARLRRFGSRADVTRSEGGTALPFADASFDRFVSTYVLDLLGPEARRELITEARRVLEPGGRACLASLTHGNGVLPRLVTRVWDRVASRWPALTGGCRPIELVGLLGADAWTVEYRGVVTARLVPSEVVVARRR